MYIKINAFPSDIEILRMQTLRKYELINNNEQSSVLLLHEIIKKQFKTVTEIPYLSHAVPSRISEFYQDFVQGDSEKLSISISSEDKKEVEFINTVIDENDLREAIGDYAYNQSEYGFEVLLGYIKDSKFYIQIVPKDQYFPQKDGDVIFASYLYDPREDASKPDKDKKKILYTQHYKKSGDNVVIQRKLWNVNDRGKVQSEIPLNVLADAMGEELREEETLNGLGSFPIQQIDNGKVTEWGFGKSDYADIMPQLTEVNERRTHISVVLLKNLDSKIQLPESEALKNEDGTLKSFDYIFSNSEDKDVTRYISNSNVLIEDTEKHVESQFKMISWLTAVPMFELLKSSMPERVESLRIQLFSAERKAKRKRAKITKGLRNLIYTGYKMLYSKEMNGTINIKYGDVLPNDKAVDTSTEVEMVTNGLSSKKSSIMRINGYTEQEAQSEIEEITKEEIASGALDTNNKPTI